MGKNAKKLLKDATLNLVMKKGFKATKVQDICSEAGVSKMTFYYYFKNKDEIIDSVIQEWLDNLLKESKEIINLDVPFKERIVKLVEWKADFVRSMSTSFLKELYAPDGKYVHLIKELITETQRLTENFFQLGKERGEVNKKVDVSTIILWMSIVSDLIIDGKFNHLFDDPEEMNKQIRELMLYGVLGNDNEDNYHDLTIF